MSGVFGRPIPDAFIAGFLHGINRQQWGDMHDYVALVAMEYEAGRPVADNSSAKPVAGRGPGTTSKIPLQQKEQ